MISGLFLIPGIRCVVCQLKEMQKQSVSLGFNVANYLHVMRQSHNRISCLFLDIIDRDVDDVGQDLLLGICDCLPQACDAE